MRLFLAAREPGTQKGGEQSALVQREVQGHETKKISLLWPLRTCSKIGEGGWPPSAAYEEQVDGDELEAISEA